MTGNKMVDTVLVALLVLATAGTIGVFYYTENIFKKPLPNDKAELEKLKKESVERTYPENYKLDKMIINLHSRRTRLRFLDIQIFLVPFKAGVSDILDTFRPQIKDSIIDIAGQMNPNELNSVHGKILLESRIKKRINSIMGRPMIKEIQFTKFVVQ